MRLSIVTRPLSDDKLRLAAQIGVTDIVADNPGPEVGALDVVHERITSFGLRLAVIENRIKMGKIVLGKPGRDNEISQIHQLIRNMGRLNIGICCYNFMPTGDWNRTTVSIPERGGALVSGFDIDALDECAPMLATGGRDHDKGGRVCTSAPELWENLRYFLDRVLPVAEDAGVAMAIHPDDPPMTPLRGYDQILTCPESFDHLMELSPSPANTICFCQGSFASMGVNVVANIHKFADHIKYVHFRDVRGRVPRFQETFHDNGPTDMAAAIRAYLEIGFDGPIRPDHVPVLDGEPTEYAGYTMLGRLHAVGYMQGLIESARAELP